MLLILPLEDSPSIYHALKRELAVEKLDGDNLYRADGFAEKQRALKGTRFTSFPPVLQVMMRRFAMNMFTGW
jgi:hypothetical protein